MNKWFYFNLLLLITGLVKISTHTYISLHIFFGALGFLLILFNWTRHAMFSTIRNTTNRSKKIKFARISKMILPFHRWIGTSALVVVSIHLSLVVNLYGWQWSNVKMLSGLFTVLVLTGVVTTGWLRRYWPSGLKRMTHLWLGITMYFLIWVHVLL